MKPTTKSSEKNSVPSNKQDELANKFPALAMANSTKSHSNIATYDNDDDDVVNDAMASLESFAPSSLKKPTENPSDSNSNSKHESEKKSNKSSKRERERSKDRRNRSRSPRRSRKHRSRSRSRDRRRHRSRDRHRSSSKDRYKRRGSHRERSPRRYNNKRSRSRSRSNDELSLDPEVGKIYSGKVENVVSFGCFVQLEGLKRRCEGLVHISQLRREGRVINASDVVSRGQKVLVKVLNIGPQKISLSMKDVDQETGRDLNPMISIIKPEEDEKYLRNPDRPTTLLELQGGNLDENEMYSRKRVQRLSSPEKMGNKTNVGSFVY